MLDEFYGRRWKLKKPYHSMDVMEAARLLNTDLKKGLSSDEAKERFEKYGPNELREKKRITLFQMFLNQFKDFLVVILIAATVVSALLGEITDAVVILAIVVLNATLGVIQESKAEKALESLKKLASPMAKVIRDGKSIEIPASQLVPGDLVLLEAGNFVPADLRLVETVNLKIEEAALTGESVPVEKKAEVVLREDINLGDRINLAFMGSLVTYGRGKGIVVATGMETEIGIIAGMLEEYEEEATPLQRNLEQFGKILGIVSLGICAVIFVLGLIRGIPVFEMFMTSVSLAVAAIPEGLPAVVTIVLALGMHRMIRKNAVIRKLPAVETLGAATIICSDKTGTLTQNQMTVVEFFAKGRRYKVSGEGYKPFGDILYQDQKVDVSDDDVLKKLFTASALCNDAELYNEEGKWGILGDPTEGALVVLAKKAGFSKEELNTLYPREFEIPFDSDRKRMTTIHKVEGRYQAFVKGAPDVILSLCNYILLDEGVLPLNEEMKEQILEENRAMASKALRVLAVAYRRLDILPETISSEEVEKDLIFIGLLGMFDPPRPEVIEAVRVCKEAGIKPVMITGDHKDTAVAIASEIGILRPGGRVLTGAELSKMTDEELETIVEDVDVYARVSPEHKMKIVKALKNRGHVVSMTGDGVNDAPALKRADIGVAMGITGTDVAKQSSDMILMDDNFASIVSAVKEGRIIFSNIRKFVFYLLSCNFGEILVIFTGMLLNLPVILKPIQLLWLNLVTDSFPALALGMEAGERDIMKIPPRSPKEGIINREMKWNMTVQSPIIAAATLFSFIVGFKIYKDENVARTFAFTTLITSELLRAYAARSERYSVFSIGFFSNRFMVLSTLISFILLLAAIYVPFLRPIFYTVSLTFMDWLYVGGLALVPFAAAEIGKVAVRSFLNR